MRTDSCRRPCPRLRLSGGAEVAGNYPDSRGVSQATTVSVSRVERVMTITGLLGAFETDADIMGRDVNR